MKTTKHILKPSNLLKSLGLIFVLMLSVSCSNEDSDIIQDEQQTIIESLSKIELEFDDSSRSNNKPKFKTLKVALAKTGLAGTVSSNRFTIFAPTDAAFAKYGLNHQNIDEVEGLTDILLYHVLGNIVFQSDLAYGFVPTLNGAAVEVNIENGAKINSSNVILADRETRNGVIHAIDDVLFPPTLNIGQIAQSFAPDEFTVLVKALELTGLINAVIGSDQLTVFAPTNAAFNAIGLNDDNIMDQDPSFISSVLLYHVVPGRVYSSDLASGEITTLNGTFQLDLSNFTITGNGGSVSTLVGPLNVQATNGVIHVIDQVILP